jgi:Aromatic-ring-opening dioxygenase LigAB, LigA subunit
MQHGDGTSKRIEMSAYLVNKICHLILHDKVFRSAMQEDVESAIVPFDVTDEERAALIHGDVAKLVDLGAASFLLMTFPRFAICGMTFKSYNEKMRSIADQEHRRYGSTPHKSLL